MAGLSFISIDFEFLLAAKERSTSGHGREIELDKSITAIFQNNVFSDRILFIILKLDESNKYNLRKIRQVFNLVFGDFFSPFLDFFNHRSHTLPSKGCSSSSTN
ncbi:hypothetical protein MSHOH_2662 [Methanosarcina horonobensis HB-1 = JCM 15518]|uniref:Uncharacterized protein n=1 Tax=Methanosarcina horonobensis HB-1 = JCM 15518 TaxID=1434110 RepID=A0A0E3WUC8_9EURY|nr:hypothetical protein [Methanosarcina horonobensis]AKB79145.1 hypothetical protein MSHOH_2662 [Methanosarcina horonobensis HB-1 = JCM 15518]